MLKTKPIILFITIFISLSYTSKAQDSWEQMPDFPGDGREGAVAFVIDEKIYAGTGYNVSDDYVADFSVYDPQSESWTQLDTFSGGARFHAATFVIGNKGYMTLGRGSSSDAFTDLWEYDPATDSWTEKTSFPGLGRTGAASFTINGKGYIGCGYGDGGHLNDFWEYDPVTDAWEERAVYPGAARMWTFKFALNGKGYIGLGGELFSTFNNDIYEYDPTTNVWTQKADFPFEAMGLMSTFVIDDLAYLVTGMISGDYFTDYIFAYDPVLDTWEAKDFYTGSRRHHTNACTVGGKGYMLFGHELFGFMNEFWQYSPDEITALKTTPNKINNFEIFPNPNSGKFYIRFSDPIVSVEVYDSFGLQYPFALISNSGTTEIRIEISDFSAGLYFVRVENDLGITRTNKITLTRAKDR